MTTTTEPTIEARAITWLLEVAAEDGFPGDCPYQAVGWIRRSLQLKREMAKDISDRDMINANLRVMDLQQAETEELLNRC